MLLKYVYTGNIEIEHIFQSKAFFHLMSGAQKLLQQDCGTQSPHKLLPAPLRLKLS